MDTLQISQSVSAPDPRPVPSSPSLAAREPEPKPEPKSGRRADHPGNHQRVGRDRGRSHVQQGLHHVVREIRHALRDEIDAGLAAGEIDAETRDGIRELQRDFRRDLQGVFQEARQDGGVDRSQVIEGMVEALQSLAAGLRELTGDDAVARAPETETPVPDDAPGALLDVTV